MAILKTWFVIINPASGSGSSKKKWPKIQSLLKTHDFDFQYVFTEYAKHSCVMVKKAIKKGFRNIICMGGDGTLHNIVNGIMQQKEVIVANINIGVIPIGTGNDWVKTHNIPNDAEKAIELIKKGSTKLQDIGKIVLINQNKEPVYFMNLAGIGFDGYVVSHVEKHKQFGALSYLIGAIFGLLSFKNFHSKTLLNSENISGKTLMVLMGLCKYSGGGMQLTEAPDPFDGLLDVTIAKNFSKLDVLLNLPKLFNGKIVDFKKVANYKTTSVEVLANEEEFPYIQADGELIGKGHVKATIIPKALRFYCS